ncbi:hypothetical protein IHE45_03G084100 [Dioscorea alata]|uniref:Uncharacterized protein n=1 Tax=Dioscorea alata TaxID=55571 RepID=A0ACB7WLN2_DIOAL|nr:hypothetical protein IHE45_03G084100 [Dioscorea alata]
MTARYKRATAPLDETARARLWVAGVPEPEIGAESLPELAELVDSFYDEGSQKRSDLGSVKGLEKLRIALSDSGSDPIADRIRYLVESVVRVNGSDHGFDAGVCTSVWEQRGVVHACKHEYVDVITSTTTARYIVETNLKAEFEIARPTKEYLSLLEMVPKVFVGTPETLRTVVQTMCTAGEVSMKCMAMHVPPWRRPATVSPARNSSPARRKACRVEMVNKVKSLAMASSFL